MMALVEITCCLDDSPLSVNSKNSDMVRDSFLLEGGTDEAGAAVGSPPLAAATSMASKFNFSIVGVD